MSEKSTENVKESFVYLDFNGKLETPLLNEQFHLKIANLDKTNPLVQVNDAVFKGSYDYAIGTNLFFDCCGSLVPKSPFKKSFDLEVTPVLCETKIMNLKPVQIANPQVILPNSNLQNIEFNFNWDYNTLLEKLANGELKLEDITSQKPGNETSEAPPIEELDDKMEAAQRKLKKRTVVPSEVNGIQVGDGYDKLCAEELMEDYKRLRNLSMRPVKREGSEELLAECEDKYKEAFEYHNIERQILQQCDAFPTENVTDIDDKNITQFIDINRCILYGLLKPSKDVPRILSQEEKQVILTLENFDNLSLTARYGVIDKHVQNMEEYLKSASEDELNDKDEFGRTPIQTVTIYKKLRDALRKKLEGIKYSLLKEGDAADKDT